MRQHRTTRTAWDHLGRLRPLTTWNHMGPYGIPWIDLDHLGPPGTRHVRSFVIRASSTNHKLLQWLIRCTNHKLIRFEIFESYNEKSIESGSNQEIGNMIGYFMKQILSECKWCKVLFTRKTNFSTMQFSFECYMMKQILSLEKPILDYRIFIWVMHYEINTLRIQMT